MPLYKQGELLNFLNFMSLKGWLTPGARHCCTHFAIGLGIFKNSTNGK
jgi:hypothetical protein